MRSVRRSQQTEFVFRTWGGKRRGAGRKPKGRRAGVPHRARPALAARFPVHVTVRVETACRGLRTKRRLQVVRQALVGCLREGFRITDWSVQGDHIHRQLNRHGPVFADRYHARILRTPREVRHCLAYVLNNARHHAQPLPRYTSDRYSSGACFDGWRGKVLHDAEASAGPPTTAPSRTWLRRVGWRRCGLIGVHELPGKTW